MAKRGNRQCYGTDWAPFRDDLPPPARAAFLDNKKLLPRLSVPQMVAQARRSR